MVRLSKIYTKFGDAGSTMLGDGSTVLKSCQRVEAYGEVDEANAAVGLAIVAMESADGGKKTDGGDVGDGGGAAGGIVKELRSIQNDLFDVGADLCVPLDEKSEKEKPRLRITEKHVAHLERLIDAHNAGLPALNSFVLPGGSSASAHLHLARTVVRRAERRVVTLVAHEPKRVNPQALIYLNRLSDLLFVLARVMNRIGHGGGGDVLWVPGAGRDGGSSGGD